MSDQEPTSEIAFFTGVMSALLITAACAVLGTLLVWLVWLL